MGERMRRGECEGGSGREDGSTENEHEQTGEANADKLWFG